MKRIFVLLAALLFASALPASPQTPDKTTLLLWRLAARGQTTGDVLVGKLPADLPNVPLPDADLIGSVQRKLDSSATYSYELYYDATSGALKTYLATLSSAGWKTSDTPLGRSGGFVSSSGPEFAIYCKPNAPSITTQRKPDTRDLTLSITPSADAASDMCGGAAAMASMIVASMQPLLPDLQGPPEVTMTASTSGIPQSGRSSAYIHHGSSATALLENFATQMINAGWEGNAKTAGPAIASQAFSKTDDKKVQWQSVVSVHAVDGKPGDFVAFVDAVRVDGASTGYSSVIIKSP
jgi:hypothetical protein